MAGADRLFDDLPEGRFLRDSRLGRVHEAKGNVVSAAVARALLDELTPAPRAS